MVLKGGGFASSFDSISDKVASRAYGTTYQNTTGKPLLVVVYYVITVLEQLNVSLSAGPDSAFTSFYSDIYRSNNDSAAFGAQKTLWILVPPGWYYKSVSSATNDGVITNWWEIPIP